MTIGQSTLDLGTLTPVGELRGESEFETKLLRQYLDEARALLQSFAWCTELRDQYFGVGVGGVIAVFLIETVVKGMDREWVWVVAGDLPAAYFAVERAAGPCEALRVYCGVVERWIDAVRGAGPSGPAFPLPVEPTVAVASVVASKLETLRRIVLPALCPPERR